MMATTTPERPAANPYVGPRSFKTGERLYGRTRESNELVDLLIAERIVLLYSPSGAGKSSLINAMIIPKMQEEGFFVTPTVRVNLDPLPGAATQPGFNRYASSMMRSLEDQVPPEAQYPAGELAGMTLPAYMKDYRKRSSTNPGEADHQAAMLLIIDQFEEVLRVSAADQEAKKAFFAQLGEVLRDRSIWALVAIREDYLAAIQQYSRPIPNRLDVTYQLDFLDSRSAIEAIQGPARESGVLFEDDAAARLADDLRVIRVQQADGTASEEHGPYVEPVQLQVVCRRLWEKAAEKKVVTLQDVEGAGNIDDALSDYYDEHVTKAAADSGVPERQIREWVDRKLITVSGIRGQVLMEPEVSGGLPNKAIKSLQEAYLVRAEKRGNAIWFELAHDRLTRPVRRNNAAWFADHLSVFQRQADLWLNQERRETLLLRGSSYLEAEAWVKENPDEILPGEKEFLEASHREHQRLQRSRRLNLIIRFAAIGMTILAIVAIGLFLRASQLEKKARAAEEVAVANAETARQAELSAKESAERARISEQAAIRSGQVAEIRSLVAQSVQNLTIDPAVSVLLARQAAALGDPEDPEMLDAVKSAEDALRQALPSMRVERILTDASISSGSLLSHSLPVFSTAFDPVRLRQRVITAGGDGTIKVWDSSTGALLHTIPMYEGEHAGQIVTSVAFSPDGKLLAAAVSDGHIHFHDAESFKPVNFIQTQQGMVRSMAFSPDGLRLVSGGEGGLAILWDLQNNSELSRLSEQRAEIRAVAFNTKGDLIVTGDANGTVRVWFTATGTVRIRPPGGHDGAVNAVAFSPNGLILATSGGEDRNIILWDLTENGRRLRTISGHREGVNAVVFTADGKNLISASSDRTVRTWETDSGRPGLVLYGHKEPILGLALSPDGRHIVTASRDRTARIWNISPEGSSEVRTIDEETNIYTIAVSPDGGQVSTAGENSIVHVRNPQSGALLLSLKGHDARVTGLVYSGDGRRIATSSLDGTARTWDATSGQPLRTFGGGTIGLQDIALSPDGSLAATASEDGIVRIWDSETGEALREMKSEWGPALTLAFTPPEKSIKAEGLSESLVAGYAGGQVALWDPQSGNLLKVLGNHGDQVNAVVFRPDGAVLASASNDGNIILWDMNKSNWGDSEPPLRDRGDAIFALSFTPDGNFLYSGGADGVGDLWDLQDRHVDFRTYGHTDRIYGVAISTNDEGKPDFLYTGGRDDTLRSYAYSFEQLKKLVEERAPRVFSQEQCRQHLNAACPAELAMQILPPVPGEGAPLPSNLKRPGDVPRIFNPDAKDARSPKTGKDAYYLNLLERPFNDSQGSIYYPDVDVASASRGEDKEWLYFTITLADLRGEGLTGNYAIELDLDGNGQGDYLIETLAPGVDWSTSGVRVWQDKNKDVGNGDPNTNNPPQKGDGYESLLFDRGGGDTPDLVWSRISPDDPKSIQIALQQSLLGRRSTYIWFAWASRDPFRPAWFEYIDHFAVAPGDTQLIDRQGNPLQELVGVDNTCRVVVGSEPPQGEGYCR